MSHPSSYQPSGEDAATPPLQFIDSPPFPFETRSRPQPVSGAPAYQSTQPAPLTKSPAEPPNVIQQLCRAIRHQPGNRILRDRLVQSCRQYGYWNLAAQTFGWLCQQHPHDAEALFFLGIAQRQLQHLSEAIRCFQAVVQLRPHLVEAHQNLASTYEAADQLEQALATYDHILVQRPDFAAAHHGRANVLRRMGRLSDAIASYRAAIGLHPEVPPWHTELGQTLLEAEHTNEAIACFKHATHQWPHWDKAWIGLGRSLEAAGKIEQAIETLRTALARSIPDSLAAYQYLAQLLGAVSRWPDAADVLVQATIRWPQSDELVAQLATAYRRFGAFDLAMATCRRAVAQRPRSAHAITQLAIAHQECGSLQRALARYRRALQLDPQHVVAQVNRALLLLSLRDFGSGWDAYEWRWRLPSAAPAPWNRLAAPLWQGESLAGKTIFVHAEQGVGDDVMFASCFDDLLQNADRCIFECDQRLVALFTRSFPQAQIVGTKFTDSLATHLPTTRIDYQVAAGSVPRFLRRNLSDFPQRTSYLVANPDQLKYWKRRLAALGSGLKIGISWSGGSNPEERQRRSTRLDDWSSLLRCPNTHYINLQYGDHRSELNEIMRRHNVVIHSFSECQPLDDLDGFAALVASLDLVISVTNATVHFAGALGVPVWTLVPAVATWRWLASGNSMPWYTSVRLFRQSAPGCWRPLLEEVAHLLRRQTVMQATQSATQHSHDNKPRGISRPSPVFLKKWHTISNGIQHPTKPIDRFNHPT